MFGGNNSRLGSQNKCQTGRKKGASLEAWPNVKTALPSRRELNLTLQMCPKGRAKNDGNLERAGKELQRPSRKSHGGLKDPWRSPKRPWDLVGPGAYTSALDLASWIYKDGNRRPRDRPSDVFIISKISKTKT